MTTIEHMPPVHGVMAEFSNSDDLVDACKRAREAGYRRLDAYSPVPVEELHDVLHLHDDGVARATLIGGLCGCFGGFGLMSWCSAVAYPLNIGGRPLISVPMFIPITFELTILCAGLTAAISMIIMNGLPKPYHPVFNVNRFAGASSDKFFLCIESSDPLFDRQKTARFLEGLNPDEVEEVAH